MQLGVKLPHTGAAIATGSVPVRARSLEAAGFDSLWVSDHVVLPRVITSYYPFGPEGRVTWPADTPYLETVVVLAAAAAATTKVRLGTAVLVVPQRNPVLLAKQIASVALLSEGRLELGVGAGWLAEEFEALAAPFEGRGTRLLEWIQLLRDCWTGHPAAHDGPHYRLAPDLLMLPALPAPVPILVGGHSARALERAGTLGDGWLGQQSALEFDTELLAREIATVHAAARTSGRDRDRPVRIVLRIIDSAGRPDRVAAALGALAAAGVDEVIVEVDPHSGDPVADHAVLRDAAERL